MLDNNNTLNKKKLCVARVATLAYVAYKHYRLPLYGCAVSAGFPSPADDHVEAELDLNHLLIKHPAATFFARAKGDSMVGAGIYDNDLLIVDRSITPTHGKIVVAVIHGDITVKRFLRCSTGCFLVPENPRYPRIALDGLDVLIWGVVAHVIHHV